MKSFLDYRHVLQGKLRGIHFVLPLSYFVKFYDMCLLLCDSCITC